MSKEIESIRQELLKVENKITLSFIEFFNTNSQSPEAELLQEYLNPESTIQRTTSDTVVDKAYFYIQSLIDHNNFFIHCLYEIDSLNSTPFAAENFLNSFFETEFPSEEDLDLDSFSNKLDELTNVLNTAEPENDLTGFEEQAAQFKIEMQGHLATISSKTKEINNLLAKIKRINAQANQLLVEERDSIENESKFRKLKRYYTNLASHILNHEQNERFAIDSLTVDNGISSPIKNFFSNKKKLEKNTLDFNLAQYTFSLKDIYQKLSSITQSTIRKYNEKLKYSTESTVRLYVDIAYKRLKNLEEASVKIESQFKALTTTLAAKLEERKQLQIQEEEAQRSLSSASLNSSIYSPNDDNNDQSLLTESGTDSELSSPRGSFSSDQCYLMADTDKNEVKSNTTQINENVQVNNIVPSKEDTALKDLKDKVMGCLIKFTIEHSNRMINTGIFYKLIWNYALSEAKVRLINDNLEKIYMAQDINQISDVIADLAIQQDVLTKKQYGFLMQKANQNWGFSIALQNALKHIDEYKNSSGYSPRITK